MFLWYSVGERKGVENILLLVESVDGGLGLLSGREGDETESTGATSLTVNHDDLRDEKISVFARSEIWEFWNFSRTESTMLPNSPKAARSDSSLVCHERFLGLSV